MRQIRRLTNAQKQALKTLRTMLVYHDPRPPSAFQRLWHTLLDRELAKIPAITVEVCTGIEAKEMLSWACGDTLPTRCERIAYANILQEFVEELLGMKAQSKITESVH